VGLRNFLVLTSEVNHSGGMWKGRRFLAVIVGVVVVAAVAWGVWSVHRREPVYEGKPVSYWLEGYEPSGNSVSTGKGLAPPTWAEANIAFQHMGADAIPNLLQALQWRDSPMKRQVRAALAKVPFVRIRPISENLGWLAEKALVSLGPSASNAVPRLVMDLSQDGSAFCQTTIPAILAAIGPAAAPAIPTLVRMTMHTNFIVRMDAIYALRKIGAEPEVVVPVLIQCLKDPDPGVRSYAARALQDFGKDAISAVPALEELSRTEPVRSYSSGFRSEGPVRLSSWNSSLVPLIRLPDAGGVAKAAVAVIRQKAEVGKEKR
jgi:hypothetical protein